MGRFLVFGEKDFGFVKKDVFLWFLIIFGMKTETDIATIRDSILKFVPARCIYLFGSYAYGSPTEDSDIDIFVVTPDDNTKNFIDLYVEIMGDLGHKRIFSIDMSFDTESSFHERRLKRKFERTIHQKGKILYEQ